MTAPALIKRSLTVAFDRAIDFASQKPETMQVVLVPLSVPSDAASGVNVTLVGGLQEQKITLSQEVNRAVFQLVPSNDPGLTEPVNYRIAWRQGIVGRTFTLDFAMPDADINFDDLFDLGNIIGGEVYLQQGDLGVPGRVAQLNGLGQVIDSSGTRVADQGDISTLQGQLNVEVVNREQADVSNRNAMEAELADQITSMLNTAQQYANQGDSILNTALSSESSARQFADTTLGSEITALETSLTTALNTKANETDLTALSSTVSGISTDPTYVRTSGGVVSDSVLPANIALVNLITNEVTTKNGTVVGSGSGAVESVNGHTGIVDLDFADVGALAADGSVTIGQVTGLTTALSGKVATGDSRLSDARTPTSHASSHGLGQSDAVTLDPSQITGLSTVLSNNGLTSSSNAVGRISSLETTVTGLGVGGGATPGSIEFWQASSPTGNFVSDVVLHSPFGHNGANPHANGQGYYLDPDGATSGDEVWPYIQVAGTLAFNKWGSANTADPYYATASALTTLTTTVGAKADSSALAAKASASDLTTTNANVASLTTTVSSLATQSALNTTNSNVSTLQAAIPTKADLVGGVLKATEIPPLAIVNVTGLSTSLGGKADLSGPGTTVPLAQLPMIPGSTQVTGWATKADLVAGVVPNNQLPTFPLGNCEVVSNRSAMLALTTSDVHQGSFCVITSTSDQGTYFLNSTDPSVFSNWVLLAPPPNLVTSVNGHAGTVALTYTDVGAMAASATPVASGATGSLAAQIASLATTVSLNAAVATLTTPAQVQTILSSSVENKRVDYVATGAVASLSGQQSADGVLMPLGALVLLTAQSSSVNNGCWVVNSGAWTRSTDFTTGSWLVTGSLAVVNNQTGSANGSANNNTFWRMTAASGVVGTNNNNWSKTMTAGPPLVYTSGNGIGISGQQVTAVAASGGGCIVTGSGIGVDTTSVVRKYVGAVPPGSAVTPITHNLNTTSVIVGLIDTASGDIRLIGPTVTGANTISLEFASAPATGQYRVIVVG